MAVQPDRRAGMANLLPMPTLAVLDRLAVPALTVEGCGVITFANRALADLLGRERVSLQQSGLRRILHDLPDDGPLLPHLCAHAGAVVHLVHAHGSVVSARMDAMIMRRDDDRVVLATFRRSPDDHQAFRGGTRNRLRLV